MMWTMAVRTETVSAEVFELNEGDRIVANDQVRDGHFTITVLSNDESQPSLSGQEFVDKWYGAFQNPQLESDPIPRLRAILDR